MASVKLLIILLLSTSCASAQTFDEWFSQRKTQKKYLLAQIEALRIYGSYVQKGYAVAKGGLGSIGQYALDEFQLHTAYYDRLKKADPALSNDPKVKQVIRWQQDIIRLSQHWEQANVRAALLKDCEAQLDNLQLTIGNSEMTPAERLQQIAVIHTAMLANLHFAADYSVQLKRYALQKRQESNSTNTLKRLYENH